MAKTPLYDLHARSGARFTSIVGWDVAASFGDPKAEYAAVTESAAILDRSPMGRFRVSGKDALDLLNRLSSYKVDVLPEGTGAGTLLTTNKGRVIDVLHLFVTSGGLLMLTSPGARQRVAEWIDAYTFMEEASLEDVTEATAMIGVLGPEAEAILLKLAGGAFHRLERYGSAPLSIGGVEAMALRADPLRSPGYDLVAPAAKAEALWTALAEAGAVPVGEDTFNVLRIEAGIPRHGWEISEDVNPWEAALQEYIHFAKGCYIGQEVVLRLNTYQKVQRYPVLLALGHAQVKEGAALEQDGKPVGAVTSVAVHPLSGEIIGLGIVRTAVASPGAVLQVAAGDAAPASTATVRRVLGEVPAGV
ncbi:MAG: aminomethyl transferase family protein [Chloroflexi bacterium]|nr:aminomethyl transferase family protein [Chloroflexota bacterium]